MTETALVAIKPITDAARHCSCQITRKTPNTVEIGGMSFVETQPPLHETCRAIFEEGVEPQRVGDIIELLEDRIALGVEVSHSGSHRFADASFIPTQADTLVFLGRMLAAGQARLLRSQIVVSFSDTDFLFDAPGKMGAAALTEDQHRVLRILRARRGRVGEPLETFWQVACHLGLASGAEERRRHYGSGFIPKLKIDDCLLQIERASLIEQIEHARREKCKGLIWVDEVYQNGATLNLELEALIFEDPDTVDACLKAVHQEQMRQMHEALARVMPRLG